MEELYVEGVATRDGPEPCVGVREDVGEASVGAHVGRAIEPRKNLDPGCRRFQIGGRQHRRQRYSRVAVGPRAVGEPVHAWNLRAREPGGPALARPVGRRVGRSGKAEVIRLR
jgi:hypothetical protein